MRSNMASHHWCHRFSHWNCYSGAKAREQEKHLLSHPQPPENCVSPNKGDDVSLVADTPTLAEHRPVTGIAPLHRSTSTRDGHRAAPALPPVTSRAYISTDIKCKPSRRHSNTCRARARNEHHPASSQHRLTAPHRTSSPTTNLSNRRPT